VLDVILRRGYSYLSRLVQKKETQLDGLDYWRDRAQRLGRRSVLNISHPPEAFDRVTLYQKAVLFPLLRGQLRGNERTVLDYGCGPGRFSRDLAELVQGHCVGVDPIIEYLDLAPASERTRYDLLIEGRIPLPDSSVDVAWICLVLGAISDPVELDRTKCEIDRVLRDDGLLFLVENTTVQDDGDHWAYRDVDYYRRTFAFVDLEYLSYYLDFGERISVMAGRRSRAGLPVGTGEESATALPAERSPRRAP
jgi:SAM-dependent methyltransferase